MIPFSIQKNPDNSTVSVANTPTAVHTAEKAKQRNIDTAPAAAAEEGFTAVKYDITPDIMAD